MHLQIFITQNIILFKISAFMDLLLKYSLNFVNFSLDTLIKYHFLWNKKVYSSSSKFRWKNNNLPCIVSEYDQLNAPLIEQEWWRTRPNTHSIKKDEPKRRNQLCKDLSLIKDANRRWRGRKLETFTREIFSKLQM